jgi:hypothetical protein
MDANWKSYFFWLALILAFPLGEGMAVVHFWICGCAFGKSCRAYNQDSGG